MRLYLRVAQQVPAARPIWLRPAFLLPGTSGRCCSNASPFLPLARQLGLLSRQLGLTVDYLYPAAWWPPPGARRW